jgi:outer membrane cobalamin receptor
VRAFLLLPDRARRRHDSKARKGARRIRASSYLCAAAIRRLGPPLLLAVFALSLPRPVLAQYPGELTGRVTDAITGEAIPTVLIEVIGAGLMTVSDGRGGYYLRGLEPGRHSVRFSRLGYETAEREVEIHNGVTAHLTVSLGAQPVSLEEVRAEAERVTTPGVFTVTRDEIEHSAEPTAAGLLEGRAGLVVQRRGPTGPQTVSVRGSSADEVLVLLDGAPLNDPLTGEADLSTIPTSHIQSITVLPGSHSARFGGGAAAGVVLIESRSTASALGLRLESGSLGFWSGSLETGVNAAGLDWTAGLQGRTTDGEFDYEQPDILGGGIALRTNSDIQEATAFAAATGEAGGGTLRLRGGFSQLERGIPGPSYQPTPAAREDLTRWRGQVAWQRSSGRADLSAQLHGVRQTVRFSDPRPPLGLPYDTRTEAEALGARLTTDISLEGPLESLHGGVELRRQRYRSDAFDEAAPDGRFDFGAFFGSGLDVPTRGRPRLTAAVRADRSDIEDAWRLTHELTLNAVAGPADFHVRHASSYSPPTFGDQFFREGVAVQPNPDLRAERIPHDLSAGISLAGNAGAGTGRLALSGYIADVRDMIIWAPDFRFVWSPRNFDVKRRGLDIEGSLDFHGPRLALRAAYSLARVTYDRPGDDHVQVVYRPRHSGSIGASWTAARCEFDLDARFVGTRYPVPAPLNGLDPYATVDLRVRRAFDAGNWQVVPLLAVDRILDNNSSLIFGYPEPGRTFRLEITVKPG